MGALKQMLIKERMRINEEWSNLKQYEFIAWQDSILNHQYYTYKKQLDNSVKKPPNPSDNKFS
jgi:hypothetical protein